MSVSKCSVFEMVSFELVAKASAMATGTLAPREKARLGYSITVAEDSGNLPCVSKPQFRYCSAF